LKRQRQTIVDRSVRPAGGTVASRNGIADARGSRKFFGQLSAYGLQVPSTCSTVTSTLAPPDGTGTFDILDPQTVAIEKFTDDRSRLLLDQHWKEI
jgi:hypothetical protein